MKASEVYAHKYSEVTELLKDIQQLVNDHGAPDEVIDRNWGYVGDLGYVAECLTEIWQLLTSEED